MILEKENAVPLDGKAHERSNCCVYFTDASKDMERAIAASGNNCCVRFSSRGDTQQRERSRNRFVLAVLFLICVMIVSIVAVNHSVRGPPGCRGKGCDVEFTDR